MLVRDSSVHLVLSLMGGIGSMIAEALDAAEVDTPVRRMGVANYFPRYASSIGSPHARKPNSTYHPY